MDLDFTADQLEFRDQVRTWLERNKPSDPRPRDDAGIREYDLAWQRTQWDSGWAGITWPTEYGGKGLTPLATADVAEGIQGEGPDAAAAADLVRGIRGARVPRHRRVLRRQLACRADADHQGHRRAE